MVGFRVDLYLDLSCRSPNWCNYDVGILSMVAFRILCSFLISQVDVAACGCSNIVYICSISSWCSSSICRYDVEFQSIVPGWILCSYGIFRVDEQLDLSLQRSKYGGYVWILLFISNVGRDIIYSYYFSFRNYTFT